MLAERNFTKLSSRSVVVDGEPLRSAGRRAYEQELGVQPPPAEVFEINERQPASANNSITRRSGPSAFNRQGAHAASQSKLRTAHRRVADFEAMLVLMFDLDARAATVTVARD